MEPGVSTPSVAIPLIITYQISISKDIEFRRFTLSISLLYAVIVLLSVSQSPVFLAWLKSLRVLARKVRSLLCHHGLFICSFVAPIG